jgi:hypothetical protein
MPRCSLGITRRPGHVLARGQMGVFFAGSPCGCHAGLWILPGLPRQACPAPWGARPERYRTRRVSHGHAVGVPESKRDVWCVPGRWLVCDCGELKLVVFLSGVHPGCIAAYPEDQQWMCMFAEHTGEESGRFMFTFIVLQDNTRHGSPCRYVSQPPSSKRPHFHCKVSTMRGRSAM